MIAITEKNEKLGQNLLRYILFVVVVVEVGNLHSLDNCHTYWGLVQQEHNNNFHNPAQHIHSNHHCHSTDLHLVGPVCLKDFDCMKTMVMLLLDKTPICMAVIRAMQITNLLSNNSK